MAASSPLPSSVVPCIGSTDFFTVQEHIQVRPLTRHESRALLLQPLLHLFRVYELYNKHFCCVCQDKSNINVLFDTGLGNNENGARTDIGLILIDLDEISQQQEGL